jgi:hypothetical protein
MSERDPRDESATGQGAAEAHDESEGPRGRTLRHLRQLLAGATSAAAGAVLLACESCGPTCCDPLPPPLECKNNPTTYTFSRWVTWEASWIRSGDGGTSDVKLTVSIGYVEGPDSLTMTADPQVVGASVLSVDRKPTTLTLTCQPAVGSMVVDVTIPLSCNNIGEELLLRLDVSKPTAIPITTRD